MRFERAPTRAANPQPNHGSRNMSENRIAILPGDGVGPEVTAEARRVLEWFVARRWLALRLD